MAKYDHGFPAPALEDDAPGGRGFLYVVMFVVVVAFAGVVWNFYPASRDAPRITAPLGAYKTAPPPEAANAPDQVEQNALYNTLEGDVEASAATPLPPPETPGDPMLAQAGAPRIAAAPSFVASGPYVAQVAALQSEAAVRAAWARLSSRAPGLFAPAQLDVERADLGQRGIYYRVRAGYFADRANASRFCDRIKQMGQDCIVVAR